MYFICECNQGFAASMVPFGAFWAEKQFKVWIEEQEEHTQE